MYVIERVVYPKTFYADKNDHTTMTAGLPICSGQLSIVGLC